ncbi:MAG TPA: penicillin acylase family protein [Stellaceae bacterium]|nr:penicillin acylase family protein [Stellaceae bacterium]
MWRALRWFFRIAFVCVVVGVAGIYLWLRSSLPQTDGRIVLPGLTEAVSITRDTHGIPTIKAQNERDAAFALGFVHAQDRLFQMDLMRRLGAGRLAEWFGRPAVETDRAMRIMGLYRAAQAQYALLPPALRQVFDAYAAGVNAFLASRQGALPPAYDLLGVRPEPWTPADSLVWGKIMDLQLAANYRFELLRARLAQRLTQDQLKVLFPGYRADAPVVLGSLDSVLDVLPPPLPASNEWVVDGKHSRSGKPLLANDTHLGFSAPGIWYLARIETPRGTLAGVTSAGEPMVVVGHNDRIAWGFTTTGGDVEDIFVEMPDPADPTHYLSPQGSVPFVTRQETIEIKGTSPLTITVRATRHGPVISDGPAGNPVGGKTVLALSATWLQGEDRTPQALWGATHAHDWQSFRAALRDAAAPEQNIVFADTDGHIGFIAPARIPIRAKGDGAAPVPGADGAFDWTGDVPFDALPQSLDPPSGRFVAANNKIVPDTYPYLITKDWELPYRAARIGELLDQKPVEDPDGFAAIQADTVSLMARRLLPLMLTAKPASPLAEEAMQRLGRWDDRMARGQVEPLLFVAWLREFNRQILADKLGPIFPDYWGLHPDVIETILTAHREWCDTRDTPAVESCARQLGAALDRAVAELAQRYGGDMKSWLWGRAHAASFAHPIWQHLPWIASWLALAIPDDGGFDTIDNATMAVGNPAQPFTAIHGPTMRMIVDMAAPGEARFMIVPGESGNILSAHYGDLMTPWRDVRYLSFSDDNSGGTLVLAPP